MIFRNQRMKNVLQRHLDKIAQLGFGTLHKPVLLDPMSEDSHIL